MTKEIELYLEEDGFYAGKKNKSDKLAAGAHKITEDEIIIMYSALMRTFANKTGKAQMIINGGDGKAVVAQLVDIAGDNASEKKE